MKLDAEEVKEFALTSGMDMVGIARAEDVTLPEGMEWAKSAIVMAYACLDETLDANMRMEVDGRRKFSKWVYEVVDKKALRLCLKLAEKGHWAASTRGGALVKAAVKAGLGSMGRNLMLVTEKYGPRVRLVMVATDAELEADEPFEGDLCKGCDVCLKACPTGAFEEDGFDRTRCIAEFSPSEEMAARQRGMLKYLTENVRIQCIDCMVSCPIGRV